MPLHARIQKVLSEGIQLWQRCLVLVFQLLRGERIQIPLKAGHLNDVSLASRWGAQYWMLAWYLCDFQGIQTSIAKKLYSFVNNRGGGGVQTPCPSPSGSAHTLRIKSCALVKLHKSGRFNKSPQQSVQRVLFLLLVHENWHIQLYELFGPVHEILVLNALKIKRLNKRIRSRWS